jgi:hypothetical protein
VYSSNTFEYFPRIWRRFCVPQITPICRNLHIRLNTFRVFSEYALLTQKLLSYPWTDSLSQPEKITSGSDKADIVTKNHVVKRLAVHNWHVYTASAPHQSPVTFVTLITHRKRILIFSSLCGGTGRGKYCYFSRLCNSRGGGGNIPVAAVLRRVVGHITGLSIFIILLFAFLKVVAAFLKRKYSSTEFFLNIL